MSNISIPKVRFVDHLNDYFPNTVGQIAYTEETSKNMRARCLGQLILNTLFSPLIVTCLLAKNSGASIGKIGKIIAITFQSPSALSENKALWSKTALKIADNTVALLLSPFYPFIQGSRLIVGIIQPKTYFKDEPLLLNDRLDEVLKNNGFEVGNIPYKDIDNAKVLSNRAFISALYNYSIHWGLISSTERLYEKKYCHSPGVYQTQRFLNEQKDDKVEEKYSLLKAFHELLQEPEKFEKNKEIVKFIEENFKTPRQKAALKMFLKKKPSKIIKFLDIPSIKSGAELNPQLKDTTLGAIETLLKKFKQ